MDLLKKTYTITNVMDCMLDFEKRTGESFFDFTLTQVDGKNIKVCREKEINASITINEDYDLFIVQYGICITIKRDCVINMFNNIDDFISEHMKNEDNE